MTERTRLSTADNHAAVRPGPRSTLENQPGFEMVDEATIGVEAVKPTNRLYPQVVSMGAGY